MSGKSGFTNVDAARFEASQNQEIEELRGELVRQRNENIELRRQLEAERHDMRSHLVQRENELEERSEKIRADLKKREEELEREIRDQIARIENRSVTMHARSSEMMERATAELQMAQESAARLEVEKKSLEKERSAFEKEKQRYDEEANDKLQTISSNFVDNVVSDLRAREKSLMSKSTQWSIAGGVSLFLALTFAATSIYKTSNNIAADIPASNVVYIMIKGAFFVGISGIFARYAFVLSRRYLGESIRISDIIHGVSFGQMYVQSYGATAGWDQVKDAFSKWHSSPTDDPNNTEKLSSSDEKLNLEMIPKILSSMTDLKKQISRNSDS